MDGPMRELVKQEIAKSYEEQQFTYAYYLELCLKTNEAPKR